MHCLYCDDVILPDVSWRNVFFFSSPSHLCDTCEQMLSMLQGKRCSKCSREHEGEVCLDCQKWDEIYSKGDPLTRNLSVYPYNGQMQDILARWKYRGDYQLGNVFKNQFRLSFKNHFPSEALVVPIPLSKERLQERAFNQAHMLASYLPAELITVLGRIHSEKQSKKTRRARLNTINPFKMTKTIQKPVILVDDLYTTGITLRHAAALLKANGCPKVYAYTLIRA